MHDELLILHRGEPGPDGTRAEVFGYCPGHGNVPENYGDGDPVLLRAHNHGGEARLVEVVGPHGRISNSMVYIQLSERKPQLQIFYPYSKKLRGKVERFRVRYETISGEKGEQTFEHPHGLKGMKRIRIR